MFSESSESEDNVPVQMERRIGEMKWDGIRSNESRTYSGLDLDVAKSALQKYIRRNLPQKAILAAIELYRLGEIGGIAAVTNLYNRLAIIANEDIGPANLPLVLKVTELVESGDRDIYRLITIVQLLSQSSKTRLGDQAWYAYATINGRNAAISNGLSLDTTFTTSDLSYINDNKYCDIFVCSDPETIRPYVLIFLKRLQEKDFNAFSWAYFFLQISKDIRLSKHRKFVQEHLRGNTTKSDILLWKALSKVLPTETHDILVAGYYNHYENLPFLQNAILIALYQLPFVKFNLEFYSEKWHQQQLVVDQLLNGNFILEIDSFVIDKHTQMGRSMGKGIQDFLQNGSVIIPQDPIYYDQMLETIYKFNR